ncbi:SPOR domain-containing protein [Novosphingobium subterraneum]|nr:SPOR domain-containing protein [Novosphingobium subterraneum]
MNGENGQNSWDEEPGKPFDVSAEMAEPAGDRLALGDEERLPWLESADDIDGEDEDSGNGRLIGFAVMGLVVLAALVGGIWYASNRTAGPPGADGSLIEASREPYKVAPKDPGGKTFEGTGDSSFKVSEGEKPVANLAGSALPTPAPTPAPAPAAALSPTPSAKPSAGATSAPKPNQAAATGGVGVQVGAFSSNAAAEAGWQKLIANHEALKGLSHRVIEGKADIGTVYRLQAVAGDLASANALCSRLQANGLKCQVKR